MAKVACNVQGPVRQVLLNRPEKRNALDSEMVEQLCSAFSTAPSTDERVAVIRTAGPVFCAGLDLREQAREPEGAPAIERMLAAIEAFPSPHRLNRFRRFRSSSLALASLDHACQDHRPGFSATLTTMAFAHSRSRWLGISYLIAEPEGPSFISSTVARGHVD